MTKHLIALFLILGLASHCYAEKMMVPTWLPADQRFEVDCTSNEIAQIDHTLALMRDALHPKLKAQMKPEDIGPTLNWIVHVSLPGMTNEAAYFDSYRKPLPTSAFNLDFLTNRASRLSYVPPMVNLSLVYDDGKSDSLTRPTPGVDYPGVSYEDERSSPHALRLTLRAPGKIRNYNIRLQAYPKTARDVEFCWIMSPGAALVNGRGYPDRENRSCDMKITAFNFANNRWRYSYIAFFARGKGLGFWGAPSFFYIFPDDIGHHVYDKKGLIEYIDYGTFRDTYSFDDRDRIVGFTRSHSGMAIGDRYSNFGEKILSTYPSGSPETTQKVVYKIVDGKLKFDAAGDLIRYRNQAIHFRKY